MDTPLQCIHFRATKLITFRLFHNPSSAQKHSRKALTHTGHLGYGRRWPAHHEPHRVLRHPKTLPRVVAVCSRHIFDQTYQYVPPDRSVPFVKTLFRYKSLSPGLFPTLSHVEISLPSEFGLLVSISILLSVSRDITQPFACDAWLFSTHSLEAQHPAASEAALLITALRPFRR